MAAVAVGGLLLAPAGLVAAARDKANRDALLVKVGELRLKTARQGAAAVSFGPYIYVFGGGNWTGPVDSAERIDPAAGKVEQLELKLLARCFPSAVVSGDRIFLLGGQSEIPQYEQQEEDMFPGQPSDRPFAMPKVTTARSVAPPRTEPRIEVFEPATGTVAVMGAMPVPRAQMGAGVLGRYIHLVGGTEMGPRGIVQSNRHDIFDPARNEWTAGIPMATARECPAVAVDHLLLVAGGRLKQISLKVVELFDASANAWKAVGLLKQGVAGHSLARLDKYLLLFGGYDRPKRILAFDVLAHTSTDAGVSLAPASHSTAVVHGDRIYVIGGKPNSEDNEIDLIQVFALNPDYAP